MSVDVSPVTPDESGLDGALAKQFAREEAADAPLIWDALVRWFHHDAEACERWARERCQQWPDRAPSAAPLLAVIGRPASPVDAHLELQAAVLRGFAEGDGISARVRAIRADPSIHDELSRVHTSLAWAIQSLFQSEVEARLGSIPYLLGTPTRRDGLLAPDAFRDRLFGYDGLPVGPLDLFLALARLDSPDAGTADDLARCRSPLWRPGVEAGAGDSPSAGEVVARWIAGGGLPTRVVRHQGGELVADRVAMPVPPEVFGIPHALAEARGPEHEDAYAYANVQPQIDLSMLPTWVDYCAVRLQQTFDGRGRIPPRWLVRLAETPTPGVGVIHLIAATLVHADEEARTHAINAALVMAERGHWLPTAYAECCGHMLETGQAHLTRIIASWDRIIAAAGSAMIWPAALAVLGSAASHTPKPAQLAALLDLLAQHVPPAHSDVIPTVVVELANAKGRTKAQVAARAFVAALA